jgi:ribosomal protein S18
MLLFFVNKFPESDKYKRLDTKVFTMLSVDKERAIEEAKSAPEEFKPYLIKKAKFAKTDNEFLEIMKSLFSVFDLIRGEFVINEKRFNESLAKEEIKKIIDYIVQDIEDYKRELKEWEDEERRRAEYNKYKTPYPVKKEEISDKDESDPYLKMSQSQLRDLIDDALDERDYEKVKILSKYIKEGKEIYLREIERLYEYKTSRKNKK